MSFKAARKRHAQVHLEGAGSEAVLAKAGPPRTLESFLALSSSPSPPNLGLQPPLGRTDRTEQAWDPKRHPSPSFCPGNDLDRLERAEQEARASERLGSAWGNVSRPS